MAALLGVGEKQQTQVGVLQQECCRSSVAGGVLQGECYRSSAAGVALQG